MGERLETDGRKYGENMVVQQIHRHQGKRHKLKENGNPGKNIIIDEMGK